MRDARSGARTRSPARPRALVLALLLTIPALSPCTVRGQDVQFGVGGAAIVQVGDGVGVECDSRNYRLALGADLSARLPVTGLRIAATGRYFGVSPSPGCVTDPFVPRDGVHTFDDHVALESSAFGTTDLRLDVAPLPRLVVSGGGGIAWRGKQRGRNAPYLLAGVATMLPGPDRIRFRLGLEVTWFRFVHNRSEVTFANYIPIEVVELGERHSWDRAVLLTAAARFPIP